MPDKGFARHDHSICTNTQMRLAQEHCTRNGLRLTPARKRVLEILLSGHKAQGAYEILDQLTAEGQSAQPPVVYRALDFLVSNGLAHRIERLNAYTACTHSAIGDDHLPAFLLCRGCRRVVETNATIPQDGFILAAAEEDFAIERMVVEAEGLCPACNSGEAQANA